MTPEETSLLIHAALCAALVLAMLYVEARRWR